MDSERSREINRFFDAYRPLQKKYNLRLHTLFTADSGLIEIWEHRARRRYICKIELPDETQCYRRAAKELEYYEKRKKEEIYVSTDRNLSVL